METTEQAAKRIMDLAQGNLAMHGHLMPIIVVFHGDNDEMDVIGVPAKNNEERALAWRECAVIAKAANAKAVMLVDDAYMKTTKVNTNYRRGQLKEEFEAGQDVTECIIGRLIEKDGQVTVYSQTYKRDEDGGIMFHELVERRDGKDEVAVEQHFPKWWELNPTTEECVQAQSYLRLVGVSDKQPDSFQTGEIGNA